MRTDLTSVLGRMLLSTQYQYFDQIKVPWASASLPHTPAVF